MKKIGTIINLYLTKKNSSKRIKQNQLHLNFSGIEGDKFFNKKNNREVLLTSIHSYEYANNNNIQLEEADLGENILVDFDIENLNLADRLQIGSAILQITIKCPICKSLADIDISFPKLIQDKRGFFAKVVQNGKITSNDTVYKI